MIKTPVTRPVTDASQQPKSVYSPYVVGGAAKRKPCDFCQKTRNRVKNVVKFFTRKVR